MNIQGPGHHSAIAIGLALLCLGLAACTGDNTQPLSPYFGDAVRQNMARQIVNPEPAAPSPEDAAVDGPKVVLGVEAYKAGKVKAPAAVSTQSSGSSEKK